MTADWNQLLEQGYAMLDSQQYIDAVAVLSQALVAAPDHEVATCYSTRAYAFLCLQQYDRAVEDCNQALELRPDDAETYAWRGSAFAGLKEWRKTLEDYEHAIALSDDAAEEYRTFAKAHCETAINQYARQLTAGEGDWTTMQNKGFAHAFQGQHEAAIKCFSLVLQDRSTHTETLWLRAKSLAALGRHAEVVRDLSVAIKAGGATPEMYLARGNAYLQLKRLPAAVADLSKYLEQQPGDLNARRLRGEAYAGQEKWRLAEADFSAVIAADPANPDTFVSRASVYASLAQWDAAIEDATRAMELAPDQPQYRLARGKILADAGQHDAAIADYNDALAINSLFVPAQVAKGWTLADAGRVEEATQAFDRAIRIDPSDPVNHAEKGRMLLQAKDAKQAIANITKAISLSVDDKQLGEFFAARAAAQVAIGRWEMAEEDFRDAISRGNDSPSLRLDRAVVCAKLGEWEDAFIDLDAADDQLARKGESNSPLATEVAKRRKEFAKRRLSDPPPTGDAVASDFCGWGIAAALAGDIAQAVKSYTKALEKDPRNEKAKIERAVCLAKGGKPEPAIAELTNLLKVHTDHVQARMHRAAILASRNFSEKAVADYTAVLKVDPTRVDARLRRAELFRRLNRHSEAADDYQLALRTVDRLDIRMQRGRARSAAGKHAHAVTELSRVLTEEPDNLEALRARAYSAMAIRRFSDAAADFAKLLQLSPMLIEAHAGQGMALARQGKYKAGLIALTKSLGNIHRDLAFAELFVTRGKVYYMMGQFELALSDYERALSLQPPGLDKVAVHLGAGLCQIHLQNRPAALPHLTEAGKHNPTAGLINKLLKYVKRETKELPPEANAPQIVPLRQPKQLRTAAAATTPDPAWDVDPLWDQWIVADPTGTEFGPVPKVSLNKWVAKGRIDARCQLLRMDWDEWVGAEEVFPELLLEKHRNTNRPVLINPSIRPPEEEAAEKATSDSDENPLGKFNFE